MLSTALGCGSYQAHNSTPATKENSDNSVIAIEVKKKIEVGQAETKEGVLEQIGVTYEGRQPNGGLVTCVEMHNKDGSKRTEHGVKGFAESGARMQGLLFHCGQTISVEIIPGKDGDEITKRKSKTEGIVGGVYFTNYKAGKTHYCVKSEPAENILCRIDGKLTPRVINGKILAQ